MGDTPALHAKAKTHEAKVKVSALHTLCMRAVGEPHYLDDLVFLDGQSGGSHFGGFFRLENGKKYYVKFPALPPIYEDKAATDQMIEELKQNPAEYFAVNAPHGSGKQSASDKKQSKSEVLVSKLYMMVGVDAACMRFVTIRGHDEDGPLGLWSRNQDYEDIDTDEMVGLPGLKEGFAADAWLANWDVIGNGGPAALNMKRTKEGRAFRLDFGGCLNYRATGQDKSTAGQPFVADAVPEIQNLRKYNEVFQDVTDTDIAKGAAKISAVADSTIEEVVAQTLGNDAGQIANILIGRKRFLQKWLSK